MPDTDRLLELALKGLEADRTRIDSEIAEIRSQLNSRSVSRGGALPASDAAPRKRRKMSAAARKRISEGMKRRYAEMRSPAQSPQASKQRQAPRLTPAGRKKLSEMMKARWAAKRKSAKKAS